ncbi:trans-aconitate 2-methyltransferase [Streptosporangium becharense]|uniref:Trans-aconitate 2-methyltransferase n=1 Tax=Streptosporangium becharense TaxID=1816182 RepID=A0A7W9MHX4_9ACTN|nr:trans-aconitate 2-methyltransferase [Streptosporangium becharense]MBB2913346.1 trans-aconitate 2-methyltransferase [Streptosporangium becharense]MBB5821036.1 trans-aconitate 2-methyltransferase [Streptosporangium becharense]
MSRDMWDPQSYRRHADERSRPFFDLVARIAAERPGYVVDAGCGTGELTGWLARRWPGAHVHGFDSSPAMIAEAPAGDRLTFSVDDVTRWRPDRPVDVIVCNAVLHWVPGHREVLARWTEALAPGGWLAFQVPGNFDAPSHALVRELCLGPWRDRLGDLVRPAPVDDPGGYLDLLTGLGCRVDAWETTYLHVLTGDDAVLSWISGTTLRPMLDRLDPGEAAEFLADCAALLREAYPRRPYGTVFPFRRIFVVARR